jgi:alpha-beta hydrolase superfamily lysophospholipase
VPDVKGKDLYLQIQNYRYPADKEIEFKGAIFFVHGFVDYSETYAHYGEIYSKLGYDFYAMDVRGHGKSEGQRLFCPNVDQNTQDIMNW